MELRDRSVLVAGGASGLGAATARRLHAGGAHVVVADLNEAQGKELVAAPARWNGRSRAPPAGLAGCG